MKGVEITVDDRGVVVRLSGAITAERLGLCVGAVEADPRFSPALATVWDFTGTHGLASLTAGELRGAGERMRRLREGGGHPRVALVAATDVDYGVARMYEGINAGSTVVALRVFRRACEATSWAFDGDGGDGLTEEP